MIIEKVELNEQIENFIEEEQQKYETKHGVTCNYTPFCFIAKDGDKLVGSIAGATFFSEVYIDELVVKEEYRGKNIGILYPAKLSLKREEQIETFPDKQKLKRLVTSRSTL